MKSGLTERWLVDTLPSRSRAAAPTVGRWTQVRYRRLVRRDLEKGAGPKGGHKFVDRPVTATAVAA